MLGEWDGLGKGDLGRQRLRGQEKRGEGALPPEPKVLFQETDCSAYEIGAGKSWEV